MHKTYLPKCILSAISKHDVILHLDTTTLVRLTVGAEQRERSSVINELSKNVSFTLSSSRLRLRTNAILQIFHITHTFAFLFFFATPLTNAS